MSLDYLNPNSKLKSFGGFIFGGSASLGVMSAGYHLDKVLEMTENMKEINAHHFSKNFNDIPIVLPSEWENEEYLAILKGEKYDLGYFNCPCSSLSQINRNASVDGKNNAQFYRVFKVIRAVQPKAFFIENAPTLVKLGYPILKDMTKQLGDMYKFTIIRDCAGNHGVPMQRMRTLVVGWRKDVFDNKIPVLQMNLQQKVTCKDAIGDLYSCPVGGFLNHDLVYDKDWSPVENLFSYVGPDTSAMMAFINQWNIIDPLMTSAQVRKEIGKNQVKLANNQRLWDKGPYRVAETSWCPSMTSVTLLIHPIHDRTFTIREYARLMGYPDNFEFFPNTCKVPIIQSIAQGVPAPFVKYITSEVMQALEGNRLLDLESDDKILIFQHHNHKKWKAFSSSDLDMMTELDSDKTFNKLDK